MFVVELNGDPLERDSELVLADVLDGKIAPAAPRSAYGVVLTGEGDAVDYIATKEMREAHPRDRGAITLAP